jgi:DNA-binding transcriptional ArsR family regulator
VLREAGLVEVHQDAQRRVYGLRPEPLAELDEWLWTELLPATKRWPRTSASYY